MTTANIPTLPYKDWLRNQTKLPSREKPKQYKDFWLKHINYCKSGVMVGGIYISGWLYWHLNFYRVTTDVEDEYGNSVPQVSLLLFRDNEYMFEWAHNQAKEQDRKPIMAFGTRRYAKSVIISSLIAYDAFIIKNSNPLVIGASTADLVNITKYFDEFYQNRPDCFSDFSKIGNWTKAASSDVEIGFNRTLQRKSKVPINPISYEFFPLKEKPGDNKFTFSNVSVRNMEHGEVKSKEELLAGITPTRAVWDESLEENTLIPISMEDEFVPLKDLKAGDKILDAQGNPTTILEKVDVGIKQLYTITFSNGEKLNACADHLWVRYNSFCDKGTGKIVRTSDLIEGDCFNSFRQTEEGKRVKWRVVITNIEPYKEKQAYCLKVDNEDHLFLAGNYIVTHNCGKYLYSKQRAALQPAITTMGGKKRFTEVMTGTGGSTEYAENAEKDFLNTDISGFYHFDIEEYKNHVNPEHFKYAQKSTNKVSLFVPAQMSHEGGNRVEIPFYEYINKKYTKKELEELEGMTILVTDWDNAEQKINDEIKKAEAKSKLEGTKIKMYYPFQPEDSFLSITSNPFPSEEAKAKRMLIEEKQMFGEQVFLRQESNGTIVADWSTKELIRAYPFEGGTHDAPISIYERPIYENPRLIPYAAYVAGLDGYKVGTSKTTDSVGVLYIFKRMIGVGGYKYQIVASLATRPAQSRTFYEQCYLLLKMYNAVVLPERDTGFCTFMRNEGGEKYLANCTNLAKGIKADTGVEDFSDGLAPTTLNKEYILKKVIDYCHETVEVGVNEDNEPIKVKGVVRIPDPMLLKEIEGFRYDRNYDRIIAFGHALAWSEEMGIWGQTGETKKPTTNYNKALTNLIKQNQNRFGR